MQEKEKTIAERQITENDKFQCNRKLTKIPFIVEILKYYKVIANN